MSKTLKIFVILLISALSAAAQSNSYNKLIDQADKAIAKQNWETAESCIISAMRAEPDNPGNILLLSNLGMIQFYQGRDSLAIATLTDAHRLAPSSVTVLCNRARVLTSAGMLKAAISDYDAAAALDSTIYQPYLYRGLINLSLGNISEAQVQLTKLNQLFPDLTDTHIALAALYSAIEQPDEAIPHFNLLIKANPQAEYYAGRAMCFIQTDRLIDASEDITSGLELDPECAELYVCRALLNHRAYRRDEAMRDAQRAIDLGTNRQRLYKLLDL